MMKVRTRVTMAIVVLAALCVILPVWAVSNRLIWTQSQNGWESSDKKQSLTLNASRDWLFSGGDVIVGTLGNGLQVKEGTNATMGTATLNGSGWVTVSTTAVATNSRIFVTGQSTKGPIYVKSRVAGTSFSIYSTDNTDDGSAAWLILQPAP